MKFLLIILFSAVILIAKTDDYILEFQAKVKNLRVFDISKSEQFRSYDLEAHSLIILVTMVNLVL